MFLGTVAIRNDRLKASAIRRGDLEGNSGAHAPRLAWFAPEGNPKSDSYVRFGPLGANTERCIQFPQIRNDGERRDTSRFWVILSVGMFSIDIEKLAESASTSMRWVLR